MDIAPIGQIAFICTLFLVINFPGKNVINFFLTDFQPIKNPFVGDVIIPAIC